MNDDKPSSGNAIRADLLIAVSALLISGLATAASWWQTRVIGQQLSAQVWPYVTFGTTASPTSIELNLTNDGLGPAVIKSFVLVIDGKPRRHLVDALTLIVGHGRRGPKHHVVLTLSDVSPGNVLRPSTSLTIVGLSENAYVARILRRSAARIKMSVCYCSILGTCWRTDFPTSTQPDAVAECPNRAAEQLQANSLDATLKGFDYAAPRLSEL